MGIGEGTLSLVVGDFLFRCSLDFYHRCWHPGSAAPRALPSQGAVSRIVATLKSSLNIW